MRKEGRGGRPGRLNLKCWSLALEKGVRTVWLGATQGKGDGRGWEEGVEGTRFPSGQVHGVSEEQGPGMLGYWVLWGAHRAVIAVSDLLQ